MDATEFERRASTHSFRHRCARPKSVFSRDEYGRIRPYSFQLTTVVSANQPCEYEKGVRSNSGVSICTELTRVEIRRTVIPSLRGICKQLHLRVDSSQARNDSAFILTSTLLCSTLPEFGRTPFLFVESRFLQKLWFDETEYGRIPGADPLRGCPGRILLTRFRFRLRLSFCAPPCA